MSSVARTRQPESGCIRRGRRCDVQPVKPRLKQSTQCHFRYLFWRATLISPGFEPTRCALLVVREQVMVKEVDGELGGSFERAALFEQMRRAFNDRDAMRAA